MGFFVYMSYSWLSARVPSLPRFLACSGAGSSSRRRMASRERGKGSCKKARRQEGKKARRQEGAMPERGVLNKTRKVRWKQVDFFRGCGAPSQERLCVFFYTARKEGHSRTAAGKADVENKIRGDDSSPPASSAHAAGAVTRAAGATAPPAVNPPPFLPCDGSW